MAALDFKTGVDEEVRVELMDEPGVCAAVVYREDGLYYAEFSEPLTLAELKELVRYMEKLP